MVAVIGGGGGAAAAPAAVALYHLPNGQWQ